MAHPVQLDQKSSDEQLFNDGFLWLQCTFHNLLHSLAIDVVQAVAAFVLQLYDYTLTVTDEYALFWKLPLRSNRTAYYLARYGLLIFQIVRKALSSTESQGPLNRLVCVVLPAWEICTANFALSLVEYVLVKQILLLYNRSRRMKPLLTTLLYVSISLQWSASLTIVKELLARKDGCGLPRADWKLYALFGLGAGLAQLLIIFGALLRLVLRKHVRTPMTSFILKNTLVTVGWVCALSFGIILYELACAVLLGDGRDEAANGAAYSWFLALLSILTCRFLLNFRKVVIGRYGLWSEEDAFSDEGLHSQPHELQLLEDRP